MENQIPCECSNCTGERKIPVMNTEVNEPWIITSKQRPFHNEDVCIWHKFSYPINVIYDAHKKVFIQTHNYFNAYCENQEEHEDCDNSCDPNWPYTTEYPVDDVKYWIRLPLPIGLTYAPIDIVPAHPDKIVGTPYVVESGLSKRSKYDAYGFEYEGHINEFDKYKNLPTALLIKIVKYNLDKDRKFYLDTWGNASDDIKNEETKWSSYEALVLNLKAVLEFIVKESDRAQTDLDALQNNIIKEIERVSNKSAHQ